MGTGDDHRYPTSSGAPAIRSTADLHPPHLTWRTNAPSGADRGHNRRRGPHVDRGRRVLVVGQRASPPDRCRGVEDDARRRAPIPSRRRCRRCIVGTRRDHRWPGNHDLVRGHDRLEGTSRRRCPGGSERSRARRRRHRARSSVAPRLAASDRRTSSHRAGLHPRLSDCDCDLRNQRRTTTARARHARRPRPGLRRRIVHRVRRCDAVRLVRPIEQRRRCRAGARRVVDALCSARPCGRASADMGTAFCCTTREAWDAAEVEQ